MSVVMTTLDELPINDLTDRILGACIEVHRHLGPGLLESAYEDCVVHELGIRGIPCERQVPIPLIYKSIVHPDAYRIDILVARRVVVEIKAVEKLLPIHSAQVITYINIADVGVGLLLNFHAARLCDQLKRFVNPTHRIPRI
jgi:GxxExxY protein